MKALRKDRQSVEVVTSADPTIQSPDAVLIRVVVAGLCRTDVYVAEGIVKSLDSLVLGHEFSGFVEKVGAQVTHVREGDRVAVMPILPDLTQYCATNPYARSTMLGVDHNGAFCDYVVVRGAAVFKIPGNMTFKQAAYLEPVAASLAPALANIPKDGRGVVYGDNRISQLTQRLMQAKGFTDISVYDDSEYDTNRLDDDGFDYVVETLATTQTMARMVRAVKPGGTIVLKSRQHVPVAFNISELVKKDITLQAVNYGDFTQGMAMLAQQALEVDDLFGDVYRLEDHREVFALSKCGESKKLFFSTQGSNVWNS